MSHPAQLPETDADAREADSSRWFGDLYVRRAMVVLAYALILLICRWLAYLFRFEFEIPAVYEHQILGRSMYYLPLQLIFLGLFGQFSGILRYFGFREAGRLFCALGVAAGFLLFASQFAQPDDRPPRSVILLGMLLSFLALGGLRATWRLIAGWHSNRRLANTHPARRLGIFGAGDAAAGLVRELQDRRRFGLVPIALFDDDKSKWRSEIHGVPVVGAPEDLARWATKLALDEIVIAMPSAPPKRLRELVELAQKSSLRAVTLPSLGQLAAGHVLVSQLRPVKFEDVLGREPVDLRLDDIRPLLQDRVVLVTGAGGSIGSELCRQVASFKPRKLLLVEQSEGQLFLIEQELLKLGYTALIVPIVADIADPERMRAVLARHRPQVLFHAAAHKHVTMMERQPSEAISNNAFGTASLAELALEHDVGNFVLISTDKAVNPTSVMGATKRLAEIYLQSLAGEHPGRTRFLAVRFGNVLGSSGSVVPIFAQQIAEGGPVTVTDPGVVRYFMTIPEAVGLVLQSFALGQGGEILVLEMGSPVRIVEMAETMIRLSGFEPDRDIEIVFTGLRPGEKLFEELVHNGATHSDTTHPRIKKLRSHSQPLAQVQAQFQTLKLLVNRNRSDQLKQTLKQIIPEYAPSATPPAPDAPVEAPVKPINGAAQADLPASAPRKLLPTRRSAMAADSSL